MFDLSPEELDTTGLEAALRRMLCQAADEYGFGFSVLGSLAAPVAPDEAVVLFRVAREAVINAGKHALASNVRITIATRDGGTAVAVEDDGVGIAAAATRGVEPGHVGLARMRDRIALLGGRWAVEALPGAGTRVAFWLPTAEAEVDNACDVAAQ